MRRRRGLGVPSYTRPRLDRLRGVPDSSRDYLGWWIYNGSADQVDSDLVVCIVQSYRRDDRYDLDPDGCNEEADLGY